MNVKKITDKLDFGPVFFVAPNPNRAIGLERNLKDYHVICSHYLDIVEYLKDDGVSIMCLNDDTIRNTGKILEKDSVLNYIRSRSGGKIPNIITFKPSPKIEKICELNGFNHIGNNWALNRRFENKINFVDITNKLKIPNAESQVIKISDFEVIESFFDEGGRCVIQLPRGFSGNSTFLLNEKDDFNELAEKFSGRNVKIAKFISGDTYTINGCVGSNDVYVGKPIYQITGFTDFNGNRLGTSGNDYVYPERLSIKSKKKIFDYTKKIGRFMSKDGYRGMFGLDFIAGENDKVDLIEINPRLVGSIPVYTKLQIENGEFPFLAMHLGEFIKEKNIAKDQPEQPFSVWKSEKDFSASQLILRNTTKDSLIVDKALSSGIYRIEKENIEFVKKGYFMEENLNREEILLQCASQDSLINPDMEYANIQASYGIMEERGLGERFSEIVELVQDKIKLRKKV